MAEPRVVRRRYWFLLGLILGMLIVLIVNNPPDRVAENFHAWVTAITNIF